MIIPSSGHGLRDEAFKIQKTGSLGVRNWKAKAATSCSNISHFQRQGTIRKITIQHAAMITMQGCLSVSFAPPLQKMTSQSSREPNNIKLSLLRSTAEE
jgi:hypothetical protein